MAQKQKQSSSSSGACGGSCALFKLCSGCAALLVVVLAVFVGSFHQGYLTSFSPLLGRFADAHGNLVLSGFSPPIWGNRPWNFEYNMLPDLHGRVALVTGANSGIGFWTALHLARQGAHVYVGCRSKAKCAVAVDKIKANATNLLVEAAILDVSSLASVRVFVSGFLESVKRLDILVLNAGIAFASSHRSPDGIDPVFATNHVGHQLLYTLLQDLILTAGEQTGDSRVVVVSSCAHYDSYSDGIALTRASLNARFDAAQVDIFDPDKNRIYMQSKLANVLFAQEAARRMIGKPVFVNSLHPGVVSTEIWANSKAAAGQNGVNRSSLSAATFFLGMIDYVKDSMWTPEEGALTQVYLAAATDIKERDLRGRYFHPQAVETQPDSRFARNLTLQKALWLFTEELIAGRG